VTCPVCGQAHPDERTVKLIDGTEVSNYSEQWRLHCEAIWVLDNLPDKANRKRKKPIPSKLEYLNNVRDSRGAKGYESLRKEMLWIHNWRRGKATR